MLLVRPDLESRYSRVPLALFSALVFVALASGLRADSLEHGLFVEEVEKTSEGAKAHVRPGDILLTWCRGSETGAFDSPFDLFLVETEQSPHGPVTIEGMREAERLAWVFGQDDWDVLTRPLFAGKTLSVYEEGLRFEKAG